MKKITTALLFVLITNVTVFAQAVLPTSWNFATTTLPTGWTSAGGFTYYSGSGNPAPAAKFQATGDMLIINFTTTPGTLSYDIAANPPPAGTWSGDFEVQESPDGITYTVVGTVYATGTDMGTTSSAYYTHAATLQSASRYVRFNFVTKTVGNVGIDNVNIGTGTSTSQEIVVKQGTTTIVNGGTYTTGSAVGTPLIIPFTVYNLGTSGTLNLTTATLSGPAMADYNITTSLPFSVNASSNSPLSVTFTPSVSGTRNAVLTIANNDPTNNPYIINLNGIGGTLATEPTAQPTALTFPINKSYRVVASFTAASGSPDGYIILRRTGSAVTDMPLDGTVYQRGDMIGNSKVVACTNETGFMPNEIKSNVQYYFAIYSYNGVGTFRNYLTTSPLAGNVTTPGSMVPVNYYSTISTSNSTLITDIHTLINTHYAQLYGSYGQEMMEYLYQRDTTGDQRVATCVYSGENIVYAEPFDWTTYNMSREHSYPQSWMPTVNASNFTSLPEYQDFHMLTPVDQTNVNAIRSNYPYGVVVGTPTYTFLGCKLGLNAAGKTVFEPRDADKGAAARCMLYQCVCYTGVVYSGPANTNCTYGGSWSLPLIISSTINYGQDQAVLKSWNSQYPPDNFEISRNDYVDSLQNNRNPFIDHPEYVCYINFDSMTYISNPPCIITGIEEHTNDAAITLMPNPNNGNFVVNYTAAKNGKVTLIIIDVLGRIVYSKEIMVNNGSNVIQLNTDNVSKGIYSMEFITDKAKQTQRVVIQ